MHGSARPASRKAELLVFALIVAVYVLLWSPYWYPGSDSGLYLSLARNMDAGRGYTYMGRPHRMVPPLTPILLWAGLKLSQTFALSNALMAACMIGGFVFMYRTLRLWLDYRIALALTAASAMPYWQFRLGTMVLSEQPFFLLFWMSLFCFAQGYRQPDRRALWLILATALMLLGTGFRIASLPFVPMLVTALWLEYREVIPSRPRRFLLVCAVGAPFVLAVGAYTIWGWQAKGPKAPRELVQLPAGRAVVPATLPSDPDGAEPLSDDSDTPFQPAGSHGRSVTRYCLIPRLALADIAKLPGLLGRWMSELILAPSREVFKRLSPGWQAALGSLVTLLAITGLVRQAQARNWWIVLPILYMAIIAFMWGFRVIPRYLTPVLPMVVLWIAIGCGQTVTVVRRLLHLESKQLQRSALAVTMAVPILVALANLPLLGIEIYARHHGDFYENTRQGAWAEAVDAAALIRRELPPGIVICTNDPLLRREIHLLTGRAVAAPRAAFRVMNPDDNGAIRQFFAQTGAQYALIRFYDRVWPEWHLSLKDSPAGHAWWAFYVWDKQEARPVRWNLPIDRQWMRSLAGSAI